MEEKNSLPELEEIQEKEVFNHDEHMGKIKEGLKAILSSDNIEEIKEIAQELLQEEEQEQEIEGKTKDVPAKTELTLNDYLAGGR